MTIGFQSKLGAQQVDDSLAARVRASRPAERPSVALDSATESSAWGPRSWEEMWRLEVSRGVSAPLVWADSLLLVASLDRNVHLVAPGDVPRVVWKENFKGGFQAAPVVTEDWIYLAETRRGARLVAVERSSRRLSWSAEAGDLVAPPLLALERIYTVSSVGEVRSYESNGFLHWTTELKTRVVAAPVLLSDALIVAASNGTLFSIDRMNGELRDSVDAAAGPVWGHPLVRPGSPPTALYATLDGQLLQVSGDLAILQRRSFPSRFYAGPEPSGSDRLLLVGHEGIVWLYDWTTAEVVWQRELPGTFRASPAAGGGVVALGDLAGTFYVLDRATGELLWHAALDDAISSRALVRDGELYVVTEGGTLYAFRPIGGPGR